MQKKADMPRQSTYLGQSGVRVTFGTMAVTVGPICVNVFFWAWACHATCRYSFCNVDILPIYIASRKYTRCLRKYSKEELRWRESGCYIICIFSNCRLRP